MRRTPLLSSFGRASQPVRGAVGVGIALCGGLFAPRVLAQTAVPPSESVAIVVHADRPARTVSPNLYGIFFEEINQAGEGGIYGEMIRNRSFLETDSKGGIVGWSVKGNASAGLDQSRPLNATNRESLRVTVKEAPVTVASEGFWGIAVEKGKTHRLRLHARQDRTLLMKGAPGKIQVGLRGESGQVYAYAALDAPSANWKQFTATLTADATDPKARLVILLDKPGNYFFDVVSLFPEDTYKRRANGMRRDLAETVADLKPGFVRFPGGCYVEGNNLAQAFRWKDSVGPIEARSGSPKRFWNYSSSDGLGYHEYLQWCEDMNAAPMYVANCGMSHTEITPLDQMEPWVQDALDAIEYANGPATSKWGAVRAKNGHPKPFNLKYVEIGNENGASWSFGGPPPYADRYKLMYDRLKGAHPEITFIADNPVPHPVEVIDEHYYSDPSFFWEQSRRYDTYPRSGPKIYVGEYAVTQNAGTGNLAAGLAEAAFMTGMETNSDLVTLSSYAPLLVNINNKQWNPNAIVFDSARVYGTPSYHVQKLFAQNRPDVAFATDAPPLRVYNPTRGGVQLGTWRTQAEFKDVEITHGGKTYHRGQDAGDIKDYTVLRGKWEFTPETISQTEAGDDRRVILKVPDLTGATDYTLRLKARKTGGDEGFLIAVRAPDEGNYLWWNLGGWGNQFHGVEQSISGGKRTLGERVPGKIETGRWYDIRLEVQGQTLRGYLDDKLVQEVTLTGAPTLAVTAGQIAKSGEMIVKVVNGASQPQSAAITLDGIVFTSRDASVFSLTGAGLSEENSFTSPTRIAPVTLKFTGVAPRFDYTFPARSLTILRFKAKRMDAKSAAR